MGVPRYCGKGTLQGNNPISVEHLQKTYSGRSFCKEEKLLGRGHRTKTIPSGLQTAGHFDEVKFLKDGGNLGDNGIGRGQ